MAEGLHGGKAILREQVAALLDSCTMPNVQLQ
jgi:hypothetical protein